MDFWEWLVSIGAIQGNPTYYSSGKAQPEEYTHAIKVATQAAPDLVWPKLVEIGAIEGDPSYYSTGQAQEAEFTNAYNVARDFFVGNPAVSTTGGGGQNTTDQGDGQTTTRASSSITSAENQTQTGIGGKATGTVSLLRSPSMQWYFDRDTGNWYASYKLPNSDRRIFFEATGSDLDAIFGDAQRPTTFNQSAGMFETLTKHQTFAGNIGEMSGTGSFEEEVRKTISLALDEGALPQWAANDPAVYDLIYIQYTEQKSPDWLLENIAKLPSFQQRFPQIKAIQSLGLNLKESVAGFLEMETGIKQLLRSTGYDESTVTPEVVGALLARGHSMDDVAQVYGIFDRMKKNQGSLLAFNEVLEARGLPAMDEDDMFKFMSGQAPQEIYQIWEETSFSQAAEEAGISLSVTDAITLANQTQGFTSYQQAYEGMTMAASNLLRFRSEINLGQYNIDPEDLIDLSLGIAPRSGVSQAEVARNMERALLSARAGLDGPRAQAYRGFSSEGTPQAASLTRLREGR